MSIAWRMTFRSGRLERIVQRSEYTSVPILEPKTEIIRLHPSLFLSERRCASSRSGRFLKNDVKKWDIRMGRRRAEAFNHRPYARIGPWPVTVLGSLLQSH